MKIAVYYNLPFSGAKRAVFEQVKGLSALGHRVDVYTINSEQDYFDPAKYSENLFNFNYKQITVNFPLIRKLFKDLSDFIILNKLHKNIAKHIDENKYDVVLVQTDHYTQAPFLLRHLKTKKIYVCLEPLKIAYEYGLRIPDYFSILNKFYESINRSIRKKIDRDNARAADMNLAISYFGRELMISSFDIYPKIFYLGVDTRLFRKKNIKKKNQILFIGQKLNMNGYEAAKKAIRLIPEKNRPELKILSLGKKEDRITDEELVNLYNESLITLCLSNYDTFGLVPLESMACEVPVIAYNVAAYRETIKNEENGFLVDFDIAEITNKIIFLLENDKIRLRMGKIGRELVKQSWSWDRQILKLDLMIKQYLLSN